MTFKTTLFAALSAADTTTIIVPMGVAELHYEADNIYFSNPGGTVLIETDNEDLQLEFADQEIEIDEYGQMVGSIMNVNNEEPHAHRFEFQVVAPMTEADVARATAYREAQHG